MLVHLDGHHLVIFLLQEIRCGGLFGLGVGELACFLFVFLFLLNSSPIIHFALIGLVAFLVAYIANHDLSFIKLLHSLRILSSEGVTTILALRAINRSVGRPWAGS